MRKVVTLTVASVVIREALTELLTNEFSKNANPINRAPLERNGWERVIDSSLAGQCRGCAQQISWFDRRPVLAVGRLLSRLEDRKP
jgi:hypothetical protein